MFFLILWLNIEGYVVEIGAFRKFSTEKAFAYIGQKYWQAPTTIPKDSDGFVIMQCPHWVLEKYQQGRWFGNRAYSINIVELPRPYPEVLAEIRSKEPSLINLVDQWKKSG
jgi:hypothetical protein